MKPKSLYFLPIRPIRALALATLTLSVTPSQSAEVLYWDGETNGSWSDVTNWSTDPDSALPNPASAPGATDYAIFYLGSLTGPRTVNLGTDQAIEGFTTSNLSSTITLRGGSGAPVNLTIGSGGIQHYRGGFTIGTAADADKVNVVLGASQRWESATSEGGAVAMSILNDVSGATGNHTLTLAGFNTGTHIAGNISDGAGTVSLIKEDSGIWELRGNNTYSGTTQVIGGNLRITNFNSLSANSTVTVAEDAILTIRFGGTGGMTMEEADILRSRINFASPKAFLGLEANSISNYTGNITGNHGLQKTGGQTVTLSGTNSYTGETIVSSGYLAFASPSAVSSNTTLTAKAGGGYYFLSGPGGFTSEELDTLRTSISYENNTSAFGISTANGDFTYNSGMSGDHAFVKAAGNTLTFGGTESNTYTGETRVTGGTFNLNKTGGATAISGNINISGGDLKLGAADQIADTAAITATGGGVRFNAQSETVASLRMSGASDGNTGNSSGSPTSIVTVGALTLLDTSRFTLNSGGRVVANSLSLTGTIETNRVDGNILIGGSHASVASGMDIGSGGLTMQNRTIQVNGATNASHLGSSINLNGTFTGSGENLIKINGTNSRPALLSMGTGERIFNITGGNTQIDLSITGETLMKTGGGTLSLTGNNTYTAVTKVSSGIIRVMANNALGSNAAGTEVSGGGQVMLDNNVTITGESLRIAGTPLSGISAGLLNIGGNNVWNGSVDLDLKIGEGATQNARISMSGGTLDIKGPVSINDVGSTSDGGFGLVLTGNSGTGTVSGNITGNGWNQNLIKNGSSTWVLSGTNTFAGLTRVDEGILVVDSISRNLGTAVSSINFGEGSASGHLRYTGTANETTSRGLRLRSNSNGNGIIEQAGTGALVFTGQVTGTGTSADKSLILSGSTIGTGELTGAFADTDGTGKTNLVKSGTGTWTLSGAAKAYEGSTTVTGGILNVSTALSHSTAITVSGGTFHIAANNVIKDDARVTLGEGGILRASGITDASGPLVVNGNARIDLSGGNNVLSFKNSATENWISGLLAIAGWSGLDAGEDEIIFDGAGLTQSQLAAITFINPQGFGEGIYSAAFMGSQLVPSELIPEPSSTLTMLTGAACFLMRRRRSVSSGA
jgi:fibronectin-binding autotransporter adhesin